MTALDKLMLPADSPGPELYRFDLYATVAFIVAAIASTVFFDQLRIPFAVFSCGLFALGVIAFLWAYAKAVERSREQDISVSMIYGMNGVAPKPISRRFHMLTFIQSVVAVVAASIHPFTTQAFGILATMLGIGLAGLWAAQHGTFAERRDGRHMARQRARESNTNG